MENCLDRILFSSAKGDLNAATTLLAIRRRAHSASASSSGKNNDDSASASSSSTNTSRSNTASSSISSIMVPKTENSSLYSHWKRRAAFGSHHCPPCNHNHSAATIITPLHQRTSPQSSRMLKPDHCSDDGSSIRDMNHKISSLGGVDQNFPHKLFMILQNPQYSNILRWLPGGKAFTITDKKRFVSEILPIHFNQRGFSSFTRNLYHWKFTPVTEGTFKGHAFYHKNFRARPSLRSTFYNFRVSSKKTKNLAYSSSNINMGRGSLDSGPYDSVAISSIPLLLHQRTTPQSSRMLKPDHCSDDGSSIRDMNHKISSLGGVDQNFPHKLFMILQNPQYSNILRWLPGGKAFTITDKKRFVSEILPIHFNQRGFSSFTRNLYHWKFTPVSEGTFKGNAFYNENFHRNKCFRPPLVMTMGGKRNRSSDHSPFLGHKGDIKDFMFYQASDDSGHRRVQNSLVRRKRQTTSSSKAHDTYT